MFTFPAVGPQQWRRWRTLRLRALVDSPAAFGSTVEDWRDADEGRWRARLAIPGALDLIAVLDGTDVGMASGAPTGHGELGLFSMWVSPAARGRGVARGLIGRLGDGAALRGGGLRLVVRPDHRAAIETYRRIGFVATAEPVIRSPVPRTTS